MRCVRSDGLNFAESLVRCARSITNTSWAHSSNSGVRELLTRRGIDTMAAL